MAKLNAGILSSPRGKVAGVVGATWKGISYVRQKVTPANPNTPAQQTQRSAMSKAVKFAQQILAGILVPYVNPFQKKMSGYNWFIKQNIKIIGIDREIPSLRFATGTLAIPSGVMSGTGATQKATITAANVANAKDGETLTAVVVTFDHDGSKAKVYGADFSASSNTVEVTVPVETDWEEQHYHVFVALNKTGLACQNVSNNVEIF